LATSIPDRTAELRKVLDELNAQFVAVHPLKRADKSHLGDLEVHLIGTRLVLIQFLDTGRGTPPSWDLFVPVCDDTSIQATLNALKKWAAIRGRE